MKLWLAVACGGALGAILRYGLVSWVQRGLQERNPGVALQYPWGTLFVNVLGSFLIGLCFVLIVEKLASPEPWRSLIMVGFLGAFTTFSSFSLEFVLLSQHSFNLQALAYVLLSVFSCILATSLAIWLTRTCC